MSRSNYSEDLDSWSLIRWRGAVASGTRGQRGQALFVDMVKALDDMPIKELIANSLECEDGVCALGAVGRRRGVALTDIDPEDRETVAAVFNIPFSLACEVVYENDEVGGRNETPAQRWARIRSWAMAQIKPVESNPS